MTRKVDQNYWNEYFQTYNAKKYDDLVNNFYTENPTFQNPKYQLAGRRAIADFFHVDFATMAVAVSVTEMSKAKGGRSGQRRFG